MPLPQVVHVVSRLKLYDDNLNTWKIGVVCALARYIPDGTQALGRKCPEYGDADGLYYEEGCLKCKSCGQSKCGWACARSWRAITFDACAKSY